MKKIVLSLVAIIMIVCIANTVNAQNSATSNATPASARILTAISVATIDNQQKLDFATMSSPTSASVVHLTPTNALSVASGNVAINLQSTTSSTPQYVVTGENNALFHIVLPSNGAVTVTSGLNSMSVMDFETDQTNNAIVALSGSGFAWFKVGADLHVGALQAAGTYTGTFNVTVAYN